MLIGINDRMGAGKVFIYSHFSSLTVQYINCLQNITGDIKTKSPTTLYFIF